MTPLNMARHRHSPHMAFWKMLKQGYDHFEVTRREPKVDVCERQYVFNAESSSRFSASDHCPAYRVPEAIASAVRDKQRQDEIQTAELVSRGTPTAPVKTGVDGGMNPTFLAAVKSHGGPGAPIRTALGTIPAHVNPPAETSGDTVSIMSLASAESKPAPGPRSTVQVASATAGNSGGVGSFFGSLFGSKNEDQAPAPAAATTAAASKPKAATTVAKASVSPTRARPEPAKSEANKPEPDTKTAAAGSPPPAKPDATSGSLLKGAAPTMPSGGFDGRFGAWQ
jgi:hypothetical protein